MTSKSEMWLAVLLSCVVLLGAALVYGIARSSSALADAYTAGAEEDGRTDRTGIWAGLIGSILGGATAALG
jgi:hypothetical protein